MKANSLLSAIARLDENIWSKMDWFLVMLSREDLRAVVSQLKTLDCADDGCLINFFVAAVTKQVISVASTDMERGEAVTKAAELGKAITTDDDDVNEAVGAVVESLF